MLLYSIQYMRPESLRYDVAFRPSLKNALEKNTR